MTWPTPLPKWFWPWVRWRRGVGEFAAFGPCEPSARPALAPARIPAWAWARLKLNIGGQPSSSAYTGLLRENGVWFDNPRSGMEAAISEIRATGHHWIGLNTGDFALSEWATITQRAGAIGLHVVPWARVRTESDVYELVTNGTVLGAAAIGLNLEQEAKSTLPPTLCAKLISDRGWTREVITFTEAWLYNPPLVDWTPLTKLGPALLEIFPVESEAAKDPKGCIAHAHELGFRDAFCCYGTYGGQTPALYDLAAPHSLFTGDAVGAGNFGKWAA